MSRVEVSKTKTDKIKIHGAAFHGQIHYLSDEEAKELFKGLQKLFEPAAAYLSKFDKAYEKIASTLGLRNEDGSCNCGLTVCPVNHPNALEEFGDEGKGIGL